MSRASDAANAIVYGAEKVLDLYGVDYTREQSRVVMVEGAAGRMRPMFFGKWRDAAGEEHSSGRADILARPKVPLAMWGHWSDYAVMPTAPRIPFPLWIECKSGKGRLTTNQIQFKNWVEGNGDTYLLLHDTVDPLTKWLDQHGVRKEPRRIVHAQAMTVEQVQELPCRHCKESKVNHSGSIFACIGKLGTLIGKVYSPDLKVKN